MPPTITKRDRRKSGISSSSFSGAARWQLGEIFMRTSQQHVERLPLGGSEPCRYFGIDAAHLAQCLLRLLAPLLGQIKIDAALVEAAGLARNQVVALHDADDNAGMRVAEAQHLAKLALGDAFVPVEHAQRK